MDTVILKNGEFYCDIVKIVSSPGKSKLNKIKTFGESVPIYTVIYKIYWVKLEKPIDLSTGLFTISFPKRVERISKIDVIVEDDSEKKTFVYYLTTDYEETKGEQGASGNPPLERGS